MKNSIGKPIYDEPTAKERLVASSRDELLYYLSPVYSPEQLKDLNEDQLKDLLDELADRFSASEGGPVKPLDYFELAKVLTAMSEEEKKNLQFMLDKLGDTNDK